MLDVVIIEKCKKEIADFSVEIKADFLFAVARLKAGEHLVMPLVRPMPSILNGVYELRLNSRQGAFRIFYYIKKGDAIYVVYAFQKKTQQTPHKIIELVKKRIGGL